MPLRVPSRAHAARGARRLCRARSLACSLTQYMAPLALLPTGAVAEMAWVDSFALEIGVPAS